MNLELNRLNLPNMVDRQLKGTVVPTETYFNPLIIMGKRKLLDEKPKQGKTEIETSLNSIVATVHRKLKSSTKPRTKSPDKMAGVEVIRMSPSENRSKDESKENRSDSKAETSPKLSLKIKTEATPTAEIKPIFKANLQQILPLKSTSIPQIKAARDQRQQQRMRRSIPKYSEINDAIHQKRILEVKKQKRILEDMLMQHQRLQRDRHSIALEIQSMREHLSDIRNKLDVSLKRLSTRPQTFDNAKPKVPLARPTPNLRPQSRKTISPVRGNNQHTISLDRRLATNKRTTTK